jgi:RNA polymerase sigma factor (TIGR02999 family)
MGMSTARSDTTQFLTELSRGDGAAADRLMPLVYDELRTLAEDLFRRQPAGQTLQPTALVHEAYLRLVETSRVPCQSRAHFIAVASKAMRQILIDRARSRRSAKRGGARERITLDEAVAPAAERDVDLLALDEALEKLSGLDERKSRVVELRFFGGLTLAETAETLGVGRTTVSEDWRLARAWVARELVKGDAA